MQTNNTEFRLKQPGHHPGATLHRDIPRSWPARKGIIATNSFGICDRLTALLLAYKLGIRLGRTIHFVWSVNGDCGAPFEKLFRIKVRHIRATEEKIKIGSRSIGGRDFRSSMLAAVRAIKHDCIRLDGRYRGHDFSNFDTVLQPSEEVSALIDMLACPDWIHSVVGVHIRRGDKVGSGAPGVHCYESEMRKILEIAPDMRFFVASDEAWPIKSLIETFGKRILWYPAKSLQRWSPTGARDAAVVLFLLRKTLGLIGSTCSGFSLCGGWARPFTNIPARHTFNRPSMGGEWRFCSICDFLENRNAHLASLWHERRPVQQAGGVPTGRVRASCLKYRITI